MTSRTPEEKHTKRFIIEFNLLGRWRRSGNKGSSGFFATRKKAKAAMDIYGSAGLTYRVRQK
ncbi:MAG: hypothetical protein ABSD89_15005 [Halobacteriota archaeon]